MDFLLGLCERKSIVHAHDVLDQRKAKQRVENDDFNKSLKKVFFYFRNYDCGYGRGW